LEKLGLGVLGWQQGSVQGCSLHLPLIHP
jgi:hypothetical protein